MSGVTSNQSYGRSNLKQKYKSLIKTALAEGSIVMVSVCNKDTTQLLNLLGKRCWP